jgi:hypothetical protein
MNAIGIIALVFFIIAWLGAIISWFYTAYQIVLVWLGRGKSYAGFKGFIGFIACGLFALVNGLIGVWFGGWQAAH